MCGKLFLALALGLGAGCQSARRSRLALPAVEKWVATASASAEGTGPEQALDGRTDTWWRSGPDEPQWLQVDMGRAAMVCGFSLQWGEPPATAYSVWTSLDGEHWTLGHETEAGDGDWDQVSIEPILARHLRIGVERGLQGTGAALRALEIKGLGDRPCAWVEGVEDPAAAALLDGDPETAWRSPRPAATVELDLRTAKPVGSVRVDWGAAGFASNVVVEVSTNRTDWISAGRIQSRGREFDVLMSEEVRPARYLRLSFSGASSPEGFAVAGLTLRGAEGAARPWARMELAAAQAPEGLYPDMFRQRQTYWAVAGGRKGTGAQSLLDEWGTFAPRFRGPALMPLIAAGGETWTARQAAELEHRLGGDGAPMPETTWRLPSGLALRIRALARSDATPATSWVRYELANDSIMTQTGRLAWVLRPVQVPPPWAGGGLAPLYRIHLADASDGWQEIRVDGEPLFAAPAAGLSFGTAAFAEGDVAEFFRRGETPPLARTAEDDDGLASAAWWADFALEPGAKTGWVVAANAQEPGLERIRRFPWPSLASGPEGLADAFDREWVDAAWAWRGAAGGYSPKIARPDAVDCLRAQLGWLLGTRDLAPEGEALEAVAWRVAALLRAGQAEAAREWIERVAAGARTNGCVPGHLQPAAGQEASEPGPDGGHAAQGQFAFIVMDYYRFTQDTAFLQRHYPAIRGAIARLQLLQEEAEKTEWRMAEEGRYLVQGLLPPTVARADRPKPVHLYSDHYWALLGWKEVRAAASRLGLNDDAAWADRQYRKLRSAVRQSLRERLDRMDAAWIPASAEEERFDPASVALLFWPCDETDLVEPHELQSSLDAFYEDFLRRGQPGGAGRIPSDEALLLIPLAAMGRGDYAREVLYALLDRRQPPGWHLWADAVGGDLRQPGQAGPMPDAKASAAYYIGVRGLAARETGKRIDLFSGAPAEWLQHGEGYQVYGMATEFGPLDLSGHWQKNRFVVQIGGACRPPGGYRIWWPRQIAPDQILANGKHLEEFDATGAVLPHDFQGVVDVQFPFLAPWPRDP